jgi:DNA modification methylase
MGIRTDVSDFWDIPTRPSSAKHYATFNTELIDKPIKAGCPVGGTILDMFCGTATTGVRAIQLNRNFIGIDGNAEYLEIAKARIKRANLEPCDIPQKQNIDKYLPLFAS